MKPKDILVLGIWHQGAVASAVWSDIGLKVIGLVSDEEIARDLSGGQVPVEEPGLRELIFKGINNRLLTFTSYLPAESCDLVAFMHDTPVDADDIAQLEVFWSDIERVIPILDKKTIIFVSAQVPLGTCDEVSARIHEARGFKPQVIYMPENLVLGHAIDRFRFPRLPVVGCAGSVSTEDVTASLFPNSEFKIIGIREAELLKHVLNGFLALCITFANEISSMMSKSNIDVRQVMDALRIDDRIGDRLPIRPGLPFAGGTLARDVQNLRRMSKSSILVDAIWNSNQARKKLFLELIIDKYREIGSAKPVGVIGLTYKLGTNTIRRSFSVEVIQWLKSNNVECLAYDTNTMFAEKLPKEVNLSNNIESVMESCDLLVVFNLAHEPSVVLDMLRNRHFVIDPNGVLNIENDIKTRESR